MSPKSGSEHVDELIRKLRAAADQLEGIDREDPQQVHNAAIEVQSCCGSCVAITGIPCLTCVAVSPLT